MKQVTDQQFEDLQMLYALFGKDRIASSYILPRQVAYPNVKSTLYVLNAHFMAPIKYRKDKNNYYLMIIDGVLTMVTSKLEYDHKAVYLRKKDAKSLVKMSAEGGIKL